MPTYNVIVTRNTEHATPFDREQDAIRAAQAFEKQNDTVAVRIEKHENVVTVLSDEDILRATKDIVRRAPRKTEVVDEEA